MRWVRILNKSRAWWSGVSDVIHRQPKINLMKTSKQIFEVLACLLGQYSGSTLPSPLHPETELLSGITSKKGTTHMKHCMFNTDCFVNIYSGAYRCTD